VEALEHVLSFGWGDVASQVAAVYREVTAGAASERRAARS
jgi:hypothetical protein